MPADSMAFKALHHILGIVFTSVKTLSRRQHLLAEGVEALDLYAPVVGTQRFAPGAFRKLAGDDRGDQKCAEARSSSADRRW